MQLPDSMRTPQPARRGTTIVECAITLPVLFLVLFSLLDLGIAATRYNSLAEVARRIAREAVLHGSLAPDSAAPGGPTFTAGRWPTAP